MGFIGVEGKPLLGAPVLAAKVVVHCPSLSPAVDALGRRPDSFAEASCALTVGASS